MIEAELSDLILTSMTDGVVTVDGKGRLTRINPAAQRILNLDPAEYLGQPYVAIFFGPAENDEFNQLLLDLVSTQDERPYAEVPFRRPDGQLLLLATTTFRLRHPDDFNQIVGAVLVFKDITALRQLRRQRDKLAQELQEKHEELKKAYLEMQERNASLSEAQKRLLWIKLGSGALAVLLFLWLALGQSWNSSPTSGPAASLAGAETSGGGRRFQVRLGDLAHTVPAAGVVEPVEVVMVSAAVAGRVDERLVQLGDLVEKGQALVRLSPSAVLPLLRRAQADQLKARERVAELQAWLRRPEFAQAERSLEMAKLHLEQEQRRFQENQELFSRGIISREEMDRGDASLRRANFDLAEAQERLSLARERGGPDKLRVAKLELANADAALAEAEAQLAATRINASISGVVMRSRRQDVKKSTDLPEVGAQVTAGQELFSLGAVQPLGVMVQVPEASIAGLAVGQRALVSLDALSGQVLGGQVRAVAPQAQRNGSAAQFPVLVVLDHLGEEQRRHLRLGMSASVRVVVAERKGVPLGPVAALAEGAQGPVARLAQGEAVQQRTVRTGLSDREFVEVVEGLAPGDTILY